MKKVCEIIATGVVDRGGGGEESGVVVVEHSGLGGGGIEDLGL